MAAFPVLKTGAVMQLPGVRSFQFATDIIQFVNGTEQRFCRYKSSYRRWTVNLSLLDEMELQNVRLFAQQINGATGVFAFTDPWDGTVYANCSLEGNTITDSEKGPLENGTRLVIRENGI